MEKFRKIAWATLMLTLLCTLSCTAKRKDYKFDGSISRTVLENYLDRSMTVAEFLTLDGFMMDGVYPERELDTDLIRKTGAKFIGRSIFRWGGEDLLANPAFWDFAEKKIKEVHAFDPDIIFQAAIFECVTSKVNALEVPAWAFEAMGRPVEKRHFRYEDIIYENGKMVNMWGKDSSVPDITRPETQLWFTYLIGSYINVGIEAIHWGQVRLMGFNDPDRIVWRDFLNKVRAYATKMSRRHYILFDAHTPNGGLVVDGISLLDFNSFPMRIKGDEKNPMEGYLEMGFLDSMFGRSKGCIAPSGWECESLPYLVEFDNFGPCGHPGQFRKNDPFCWGYDEITWFYLQDPQYRKDWLVYADKWVTEHDPAGHLQMPGTRKITDKPGNRKCRAIAPTAAIPDGMDLIKTIKKIWKKK